MTRSASCFTWCEKVTDRMEKVAPGLVHPQFLFQNLGHLGTLRVKGSQRESWSVDRHERTFPNSGQHLVRAPVDPMTRGNSSGTNP
jgi:hypothetical protein